MQAAVGEAVEPSRLRLEPEDQPGVAQAIRDDALIEVDERPGLPTDRRHGGHGEPGVAAVFGAGARGDIDASVALHDAARTPATAAVGESLSRDLGPRLRRLGDAQAVERAVIDGRADAVIGSRFLGQTHRVLYYWHFLANTFITLCSNIMTNLNITEQALFKKYQNGVCQEVPSNFLVRFFLSPVAAIETIDLSDGLKLTLEIENFKISETQKKKISDMDTEGFSRSYTLKRAGSLGKTVHSFQESFFNSIKFKPRQHLWNEISKNLMRQPKGRELMKELKKDREQVTGLILESETIIEATLVNGEKSSGTISVTTIKSGTSVSPTPRFKIPQNYELFSAESLKLVAQSAEKKQGDSGAKKSDQDINLMDQVQSAFFCAIAGAFACFSK
jgi:hypothetical protein